MGCGASAGPKAGTPDATADQKPADQKPTVEPDVQDERAGATSDEKPTVKADAIKADATAPDSSKPDAIAPAKDEQVGSARERLARLLTEGCDDRITVDPKTGMHKYNGTNVPVPGAVSRSSCTFSVPTEDMFQAGLACMEKMGSSPDDANKMSGDICSRIRKAWQINESTAITLCPSGTDAEFIPLLVALVRAQRKGGKVTTIVTAAGEVGSGTSNASGGRHFAPLLPVSNGPPHEIGGSLFADTIKIDIVEEKLRTADGRRHEVDALDDQVAASTAKAIEDGADCVVVHLVVGCKTGQCMPSLQCVESLVATYKESVLVVVDACQGRMVDHGLQAFLTKGFAVLATGSKFYGGPPFCGAAMLPEPMVRELNEALADDGDQGLKAMIKASTLQRYIGFSLVAPEMPALRDALPEDSPNWGLLLRWAMSLYSIELFHSIPEDVRDGVGQNWVKNTAEMIDTKGLPTVSTFNDVSTGEGNEMRRQITKMAVEDAKMFSLNTIIILDLKCPDETGSFSRMTSIEEMRKVHKLMGMDLSGVEGLPQSECTSKRMFIAQPVTLARELHIIRIALSAPLVSRLHSLDANLQEVEQEDRLLIDKLDIILRNWSLVSSI